MSQHDRQRGAGCRKPLGWIDLGRTDVERVNACQRRWREGVLRGDLPEVLLLTEHDPCYTFGHRAQREDLRLPLDQLRARGFKVVETERGGRITYHGPGQLVCYPILDLFARNLDVAGYVSRLEGVMIGLARRFGVEATRRPGFPGVWCGREKLGAVGIHIHRGVTIHGCAFNAAPDLSHFSHIVPCGLRDAGVTSLARLLGSSPPRQALVEAAVEIFGEIFGTELQPLPHSCASSAGKRGQAPATNCRKSRTAGRDAPDSIPSRPQ